MRELHGFTAWAVAMALPAAALASPILDASYFDALPATTLVDFQTDGSGNAVVVPLYSSVPVPTTAYQSLGFDITGASWVNDGAPHVHDAIALGGPPLPNVAIFGGANYSSFELEFASPVGAVGLWVVCREDTPLPCALTAYDPWGFEIERIELTGAAIDGTVPHPFGPPYAGLDYGFVGISSSVPIASVVAETNLGSMVALRFSAVPEPSTALLFASGLSALAVRRRRRFTKSRKGADLGL